MTVGWGRAVARTRVIAAVVALGLAPVLALAVAPADAADSVDSSASSTTLRTIDVTWDQVAQAQADVTATARLVTSIKSQLAGLQAAVDSTQADITAKGDAYARAQDALDGQQYKVGRLQAQVDLAQSKAAVAKKTSNQLLAAIGKTGGGFDVTTTLLSSSDPGVLLSQLSTYGQVTSRAKEIIAQALAAQNAVQAITDQANAAKAILATYKDTAAAAFQLAQVAAQAAQTALAAQQAAQAQLEAKLSVLTEHRNATLADYNASLAAKWGPGAAGIVSASGWANPANGHLNDGYGMRWDPINPGWRMHSGQDIGAPCTTPIYAAHAGTVTYAGRNGTLGNYVQLDNGAQITTGYGHIVDGGILVSMGQQVGPGQQIARVGTTGASTGCHLHYLVRINGALTDPLAFMRDRGVTLGS